MKWIKKTTNILLIVVLALGFSVGSLALTPYQQASAIGVIGSNAVKSVVIGSMERAGVNFGSKEAKEKAFDAWNMKAYEKWKADEAAGRNADLWQTWHAFEQNPSIGLKPAPDAPNKPGVGKFLLDATIFGMAIGIGAEIGYAIEDAQANERMIKYAASEKYTAYAGLSDYSGFVDMQYLGRKDSSYYPDTDWSHHYSFFGGLVNRTSLQSKRADPDPAYGFAVYKIGETSSSFVVYTRATRTNVQTGRLITTDSSFSISKSQYDEWEKTQPMKSYDMVPQSGHVPRIAPVPELAPLVAPNPDLAVLPEVLPMDIPVEVVIPSEPEIDPFWDGQINDPYVPPTPGTDPDKDPDAPPGTDPDKDPDAPPGTDPGGDPDAPPGTDPGKDEETPPGKDEEQPPKEDEENSCDASLKKPDFKKVGVAFTHAFPFSLPWDLKRFFDAAFSGIGSEKPSVDLTFLGDGVTLTIPDYFDSWVDIAKNLMVILFDISLIWMFARFMQRGGGD